MENKQPRDLTWPSHLSPELIAGHLFSLGQQKQSVSPDVHFESAMSSLVSSPSSNPPVVADSAVIGELIGRLGSICNSGEVSPESRLRSTNHSRYSTPQNSPPKIGMPGIQLVKREPMLCDLYGPNYGGFSGQFGLPEIPAVGRVQLDTVMRTEFRSSELGNGPEVPSMAGGAEGNARKRKAGSKGKGKEAALSSSVAKDVAEENSDNKRSKPENDLAVKLKTELNEKSGEKQEKDNNVKPPEPPKDYIHVRARRGQATDSHSLAERVRREKISERMKFLQDLVPGCNKVTGKAVMLDEIINYVQSLQRQVEFLSMKLAAVNPCSDFNAETMLPKENQQGCSSMPQQPIYHLISTSSAFPYQLQPQGLESSKRNFSTQLPSLDGFTDAASQMGNFWEDDLQSVVQMNFGQSQENIFSLQNFQGN